MLSVTVSVCSALLIVTVIFVTTLFLCVFPTFVVNKDDHYTAITSAAIV